MTPFAPLVQSQFQQGFSFIQQAMLVEQTMGNLPAAAQNYDQAIGMISSALGLAAQSGLPIQDNVFFCLACCHFHAARVKAAAGYPQFAPMHLAQAHQALGQALAMNPNFSQYHSAAGVVLLAEGNVAMAAQSFLNAIQLNPMDSWSRWMLASIYSIQGNEAASQQCYLAAAQGQPALPPPQQFLQPYRAASTPSDGGDRGGKGSQRDWFELLNNAVKLGNTMAGFLQQGDSGAGGGAVQGMWDQSGWNA